MATDFARAIRSVRRQIIPPSAAIISETLSELGISATSHSPDRVQAEFDSLLEQVYHHSLKVLEKYEDRAYADAAMGELVRIHRSDILKHVIPLKHAENDEDFMAALQSLLQGCYLPLRQLFKSIGNSRSSRGGKDFELQLAALLDLLHIPYDHLSEPHHIDFMIPSESQFRADRRRAILLSVKRTLRERWKQVVDDLQQTNSPHVYLVTADRQISIETAKGIGERNIYLVVWDDIKARKFHDNRTVFGFTEFAGELVDHIQHYFPSLSPD